MFKEHAAALIYKITGGGIDLRTIDLSPQLATLRPILEQLITDKSYKRSDRRAVPRERTKPSYLYR